MGGQELHGFAACSLATRAREHRDADLADAGRKAVLRRPGLNLADQLPVALDHELDEAVFPQLWAALDLPVEPVTQLLPVGREGRRVGLAFGDERIDVA